MTSSQQSQGHRGSRAGGIGRATLQLSLSNAFSRAVGLGAALVSASLLGGLQFGVFAFVTATAAFASASGQLGMAPLLTQRLAQNASVNREASVMAAHALRMSVAIAAMLAVLLSAFVDPKWGIVGSPDGLDRAAVWMAAAWSVPLAMNPIIAAAFAGYSKFGWLSGLNAGRAIAVALLSCAGALAHGTALAAVAGAFAAETLMAAIGLLGLREKHDVRILAPGRPKDIRAFLRSASGSGLASLSIQASMWCCQVLLLQAPGGVLLNGGFLLATRASLVVTMLPNALAQVALPRLASVSLSEWHAVLESRRLIIATLVIASCSAVLLSGVGWIGIGQLGAEYVEFRLTVVIMAACGIATAVNNVMSSAAVATCMHARWIASDVVLAVAVAVVAFVLIPTSGAEGAAIAHSAGYALSCLVLMPVLVGSKERTRGAAR